MNRKILHKYSVPILEHLRKNHDRYMEILRDMVQINSHTRNIYGIDRLADYTSGIFGELNFESERKTSHDPRFGRHLILSRGGKTNAAIACISHLDTVYTQEEEEENGFRWIKAGDMIYGPGVVDIKGGTVVMYMMMDALKAVAPHVFNGFNWEVLFNASEEEDSGDFRNVLQGMLKDANVAACCVFEGGSFEDGEYTVVTARKGRAVADVRVSGRGGHSGSSHEKGANAIYQLAEIVQKVSAMTDYGRGITFNVGTIRGGTALNRIPHEACIGVEMRAYTVDEFEDALKVLKDLDGFSSVTDKAGLYRCSTVVEILRTVAPWPENRESGRLYEIWKSAGDSIGITVRRERRGGTSDGNLTWNSIPTLDGLGPCGGNSHCSVKGEHGMGDLEYISETSLTAKASLNTLAIIGMADQQGIEG